MSIKKITICNASGAVDKKRNSVPGGSSLRSGGIKAEHIPDLIRTGVKTVAVVTAAENPRKTTKKLLTIIHSG